MAPTRWWAASSQHASEPWPKSSFWRSARASWSGSNSESGDNVSKLLNISFWYSFLSLSAFSLIQQHLLNDLPPTLSQAQVGCKSRRCDEHHRIGVKRIGLPGLCHSSVNYTCWQRHFRSAYPGVWRVRQSMDEGEQPLPRGHDILRVQKQDIPLNLLLTDPSL